MERTKWIYVGEGVIRSFVLTLIFILILAIAIAFTSVSAKFLSVYYLLMSIISIMYGTIYAVRKVKSKGWVIGIIVAFLYMIILLIYTIASSGIGAVNSHHLYKFILALIVGALSGMLAINSFREE